MAAFYFAISILLVGLTSTKAATIAPVSEDCDTHGADRRECGWLGITEETCGNRSCCWDSSDPNAKWCFLTKTTVAGSCNVQGADRRECGWLGIDEATCLSRDCCWDATDPNAKWCFVKTINICKPVAPSQRVDCGFLGITKKQCQDKGCCWDDSVPNTIWCHYEV